MTIAGSMAIIVCFEFISSPTLLVSISNYEAESVFFGIHEDFFFHIAELKLVDQSNVKHKVPRFWISLPRVFLNQFSWFKEVSIFMTLFETISIVCDARGSQMLVVEFDSIYLLDMGVMVYIFEEFVLKNI